MNKPTPGIGLRLGIDTGGTFTDAVLVDERQQIVAAAKSLTTRCDLTVGIGNALSCLASDGLQQVTLVALSTTLSTNSVVEGRGARVGVLLPGYNDQQVHKSGLLDIFEDHLVVTLAGGHDALGKEKQVLDEQAAKGAIMDMADSVSAYAISSMFGVRNPVHEIRLRELVSRLSDKPVTCGHELANSLDAPRRALTVALNARMVPIIRELILAMQKIMKKMKITAPLMMVKGNGSLINTETALRQPVGTVLSGPAASVVGACALSGAGNAIIADMGGTTTDVAVITNGLPELDSEGVRIGHWRPMVEAVRVISIGLGGDSEVRFSGSTGIEIGPRRVVPLSLLAHQYPSVTEALNKQLVNRPDRRDNRFALQLEQNEVLLSQCTTQELDAFAALHDQPVELAAIMKTDRAMARAIARLQRMGLVIYSGFTPSDAAHVLGLSSHWNNEAAELAALVWARQMRHVYGLGRWHKHDAITPSQHVFEQVIQRISRALIEAGLHQHRMLDQSNARNLTRLLAELIYESSSASTTALQAESLFHLRFARDHPVVAVGAPAATFFPDAASHLGVELTLPMHGDVANAYGAVMGSVVQRAHVMVTQPVYGDFVVHSDQAPIHYDNLEKAHEAAADIAREKVMRMALEAGTADPEMTVSSVANHVHHDLDGDLFLETQVTATATGRPSFKTVKPLVDEINFG